jgi:hypothetical protein
VVVSDEMVKLQLRVTMNQRPHLFSMDCVVWERGALHHDMLISQTVAVRTGLGVFVHDNLLREVIMGKQALLRQAEQEMQVQQRSQGDERTRDQRSVAYAISKTITDVFGKAEIVQDESEEEDADAAQRRRDAMRRQAG